MGGSNFNHGVKSYGFPILPGLAGSIYTGNVFFVHYTSGNDGNIGDKDHPFKTLDYAVGKCTADNGDLIILLPGHSEAYSAAGGLDLDVSGITVVGVGQGANQPVITLNTADTADIDIDAANITIENVHFKANFADIAAYFDVNSDDFTLRGCRMSETASAMNALIWIQDAAAGGSDRITVQDCWVSDRDAANTHFINLAGTGAGHIIKDNTLIGDWGTIAVGGAGVVVDITVSGNKIYNVATTSDACINLAASSGVVVGNDCMGGAVQANGITAAGCLISRNYYGVISEDLSALLDPILT